MNEPQKIVLDNGLTILIQESHNAAFDRGSRRPLQKQSSRSLPLSFTLLTRERYQ